MFEYWFMFPVAFAISSVAMMSGIGGAILFSPFFLLVLGLEPSVALGLGLFIEIFGFSSGVMGFMHLHAVNYAIVKQLFPFAIIGAVLGAFLNHLVAPEFLIGLLALLVMYLGFKFAITKKTTRDIGKNSLYRHAASIKSSTFFGGLMLGLVSSGLGEINEYNFLGKLKLKLVNASATSVFLVAITAIVGIFTHFLQIMNTNELDIMVSLFPLLLFCVPGVVLGAQFGVHLARIVNFDHFNKFIAGMFFIISILLFMQII